jgi:hypothetical protein
MKRNSILVGLLLLIAASLSAQSVYVDTRLDAVYSEEYLSDLELNNQDQLKYLNWYLDNSYTIVYAGIEKCEQMPYLIHFDPVNKIVGDNVESVNEETFNVFKYYFERGYDTKAYYRIGNTGKAIVLESVVKLAKNFNIYQDEN